MNCTARAVCQRRARPAAVTVKATLPTLRFPPISSVWSCRLDQCPLARRQLGSTTRVGAVPAPCYPSIADASTFNANLLTPEIALVVALAAALIYALKVVFDTPSRKYSNNVGDEYDAWTEEGILQYYWGEHIHLGYYDDEERERGAFRKDFKKAKFDFTDRMLEWSGAKQPKRILDVGCGIGGTSRHLAKLFPSAEVVGITLSTRQQQTATRLAAEQGLNNAQFRVMDALKMEFADDSFDLVWACESGEHMPDKGLYVQEMTRVLAPEGQLVIACWCQRDREPFTPDEKAQLQFLYDEWAHPFFISKEQFVRLMQATGKLENTECADWTEPTLPSWRHSVWVGIVDPWIVIFKFNVALWYKVVREIVTIERMHRAFASGLMEYGMMRATKLPHKTLAQQESGALQLQTA